MKPTLTELLWATATAIVAIVGGTQAIAADEKIPLIEMKNIKIEDAIVELAHEGGFNCILDPGVVRSRINLRLENLTARQALETLLKEQNLKMVDNPATTVARIVSVAKNVKPIPASHVRSDTNGAISKLILEGTLAEAFTNLTTRANLKVSLQPELTDQGSSFPIWVSVRWENITARQALAALLDNYDLAISENQIESSALIRRRTDVPADRGSQKP